MAPRHRGVTHNLQRCIVNPATASDDEWNREVEGRPGAARFNTNRKFVLEVKEQLRAGKGVIVLIPQPQIGLVYLGRIKEPFEVVNDPDWAECYLNLRASQGLHAHEHADEERLVADVAQGWPVSGGYQPVPLSRIPGWIRRTLTGQSTYGRFRHRHPLDPAVTAYRRLDEILNGKGNPPPQEWTLDPDEIGRRLVDVMTPNLFEHLVVSLLQLDHSDEVWLHTGGPGDGGIDGFGADRDNGRTVAVMQAKYDENTPPDFGNLAAADPPIRRYWAMFLPANPPPNPPDGVELLGFDWVVDAVRRRWRKLPLALTLRIGDGVL